MFYDTSFIFQMVLELVDFLELYNFNSINIYDINIPIDMALFKFANADINTKTQKTTAK